MKESNIIYDIHWLKGERVPPYSVYEQDAEELSRLGHRIRNIKMLNTEKTKEPLNPLFIYLEPTASTVRSTKYLLYK